MVLRGFDLKMQFIRICVKANFSHRKLLNMNGIVAKVKVKR